MIIGLHEIRKMLATGQGVAIIPHPRDDEVDQAQASIDLRLGRWFVTLKQSHRTHIDLSNVNRVDDPMPSRKYFVPFEKEFVLHPGRFVLGTTLEWIKLGAGIAGYVIGKSKLGRKGLVIETAAGIHPGFRGCLTLELTNVGEAPLIVRPGMQVCQVFFHRVEGGEGETRSALAGKRRPAL